MAGAGVACAQAPRTIEAIISATRTIDHVLFFISFFSSEMVLKSVNIKLLVAGL